MASSSPGTSRPHFEISLWIYPLKKEKLELPVRSYGYAESLYKAFSESPQILETKIRRLGGVEFFHIKSVHWTKWKEYIEMNCSVSSNEELDQFYTSYRSGCLTKKITEYAGSIGFQLEMGISPVDDSCVMEISAVVDKDQFVKGKKYFVENFGAVGRLDFPPDKENKPTVVPMESTTSGVRGVMDDGTSPTYNPAKSGTELSDNRRSVKAYTEQEKTVLEKHFRVYLPDDIQTVKEVRIISDKCEHVNGQQIHNIPGTQLWERKIIIPGDTEEFWYKYSVEIKKSTKILNVSIPGTKHSEVYHTMLFKSSFSAFQFEIIYFLSEKLLAEGYECMCFEILKGVASANLKDTIMQIETLQNKVMYLGYDTKVGVISSLISHLQSINSTFYGPFSLAFLVLMKLTLRDISYHKVNLCMSKEFAFTVLRQCREANLEELPTNCRESFPSVLQVICEVAFEGHASVIHFMEYTYPLLPVEVFTELVRKSQSDRALPLYSSRTSESQKQAAVDIFINVCRHRHKEPPEKKEQQFLTSFQRLLPLEFQLAIVHNLEKDDVHNSVYANARSVVQTQCKVTLMNEGKKGEVFRVIELWNLIQNHHFIELEEIQKKVEETICVALEKVTTTEAKNCHRCLQKFCLSGNAFQDLGKRAELLHKLVTSKHEEIHYLYILFMREQLCKDINEETVRKLTVTWFETAEGYCRKLKRDKSKSILRLYGFLADLMMYEKSIGSDIANIVLQKAFDFLFDFDILDILNVIYEIENMSDENMEDLYRMHVQKYLRDLLTNGSSSIGELSKRIAGTTSMRVNSRVTCCTWITLMENTGIDGEMPLEDAFSLVLDYRELWKGISKAKGTKVQMLKDHQVYKHVQKVICKFARTIQDQSIKIKFFKKIDPKFDACEDLLQMAGQNSKGLKKSWDDLMTSLDETLSSLDRVLKVISNVKENIQMTEEIEVAIEYFHQVLSERKQELLSDSLDFREMHRSIKENLPFLDEVVKSCCFLERTSTSKVFWNIFNMNQGNFEFDNPAQKSDEEFLGLSLLFEDAYVDEQCDVKPKCDLTLTVLDHLSNKGQHDYKTFWEPLLDGSDVGLPEVIEVFKGADLTQEVELATQHFKQRVHDKVLTALRFYFEFEQHSESVTLMKQTLEAFKIDYTADEIFINAVETFEKLQNNEFVDLTLLKVGDHLASVSRVLEMTTPAVKSILAEVVRSSSLIEFLKEVMDEDIRNLIDAVEEHSEQYVRESTVSDLIDIKRFFQPMLKQQFDANVREFFNTMKKTSESLGFDRVPEKIHECMSNLHSLKALYKNVANRGERTREIIETIIKQGKFFFKLAGSTCEVSVHYKQDKKAQCYKETFLNDLRSRALLIVNTEEKRGTKHMGKDNLQLFVELVDLAMDISCICLNLKRSGHFLFAKYEQRIKGNETDLMELRNKLQEEYNAWCNNLEVVRKKYCLMNFIYSDQLQLLFEFFNSGVRKTETSAVLKFIHPRASDWDSSPTFKSSDLDAVDTLTKLESMGESLNAIFEDFKPAERRFKFEKVSERVTDTVQPGRLFIAALDENSTLVIRTLLALYLNTTGKVPEPHQVLFCSKDTKSDEFVLLLQRCIKSNSVELYCIVNVELLSSDLQFHLVEELQRLPHSSKFLLAIICRGNVHHNFLEQFTEKIVHARPLTDVQMKNCFKTQWPRVVTVTSDVPGLGKTEMIRKIAANIDKSPITIHISGSVSKKKIVEQLVGLGVKEYHLLHIDIGSVSDPFSLDTFLFELIVLQYVASGTTSFVLCTEDICIEIANSVNHNLSNSLPTTTCFQRKNLQWENYDNMKVSQEISSPVQVVSHFLHTFDMGKIDQTDLYFSGNKTLQPLPVATCRSLLRQYFSASGDMSFAVVNTFINVLADQLKKLSTSIFFRTSHLQQKSAKSELVRALIDMSNDFSSRSINSCRSMQASTLFHDNEKTNLPSSTGSSSSAEILAKRVEGMIRWEDSNHLMVLFHQDLQTVSALFRNVANVPKHIKKLFESQLGRKLQDFQRKTQLELQIILQKLARPSLESIPEKKLHEMSKSYALTADNLLKMVLISLRMKGHVPIIIMGETGCGKTSLVRYLANICDIRFEVLSIHAGITEDFLVSRVKSCDEIAKESYKRPVWLFLDEINTCDHLGLISDIICHHRCYGTTLAPNLTLIAACNPYRLRSVESIHTAGLQGKIKTDELSRLVYRVHPLPETMVDYVWDYGSLNALDEDAYIKRMVHSVFSAESYTQLLAELLTTSQKYVRDVEGNDCSVSLRDVERCKKLVCWFREVLGWKEKLKPGMKYSMIYTDVDLRAVVLSLAICYHSRFTENSIRKVYRQNIAKVIEDSSCIKGYLSDEDIADIIMSEENDILDRMDLPEGTAKNTALRENVFVTLVCILNRIPVFVVGKPGCSKSLSMQLIRSNLRGKDSRDSFFKKLPQLYCVSFQGSESSTSDGINKVFDKALKYQEYNNATDVLSVVILDEIGLAEISRFNPLKVLHSLLEPPGKTGPDVAVVGVSNWALDAAKMNRAIHLSRPEMDLEDLHETAISISTSIMSPKPKQDDTYLFLKKTTQVEPLNKAKDILKRVARAYHEYSSNQKFRNFHGLRDFYSLTKHISKGFLEPNAQERQNEIIHHGLLRNLGGLPTETDSIVEIFCKHLDIQIKQDIAVLELIKENIQDKTARHLMLITCGDAVISVLEDMLEDMGREHVVIFGSHFEEDLTDDYNYRILSRIILCMEQGLVLILKDLENIYGSLYDMLNQNYTTVGNKRNCRIALGPYSNPMCHVHEDFKCVVLVEESKLDYSDPPFLNRFEKQQFRFSDLMDEPSLQFGDRLKEFIDEFWTLPELQFGPTDAFPIFSDDVLYSLVLSKKKHIEDTKHLLAECKKALLWISKPEAIVRMKKRKVSPANSENIKSLTKSYMELPLHKGIEGFLNEMEVDKKLHCEAITEQTSEDSDLKKEDHPSERMIPRLEEVKEKTSQPLFFVFTYSNIHVNMHSCCGGRMLQAEKLGAFKSEKRFSSKVKLFFQSEKDLLTIQCSDLEDSTHILLAKTVIENHRHQALKENPAVADKCICIIVHIDRDESEERPRPQINFLSGWKLVMLDSIEKPKDHLPSIVNHSVSTVLQVRRPLCEYLKDHLFWAFSRMKYSGSGHSVERMMAILQTLQTSYEVLSCLENLIFSWIDESTSVDYSHTWQVEIACDKYVLSTSSCYITALENHLLDTIKKPLAMVLFGLEAASSIHQPFVMDAFSAERMTAWKSLLESGTFIDMREIPEPSGPECYNCTTPALELNMPFSYVVHQEVERISDDFVDTVKRVKIACDMEEEELPKEVFLDLTSKYQDVILQEIPDIHSIQYEGHMEDYTNDFCDIISVSLGGRLEQKEKAKLIHMIMALFIDVDALNLCELVTKIHAAYWTYSPIYLSIVQIVTVLKFITDIPIDQVLKEAFLIDEVTSAELLQEDDSMNKVDTSVPSEQKQLQLVEYLCRKLIPSENMMKRMKSIRSWQQLACKLLPLIGNVSSEPEIVHALKFCNDLASVLYVPYDLSSTEFSKIGHCILENAGHVQSEEVFQIVVTIMRELKENGLPVKILQKAICMYIYRCFAADLNADHIYTLILKEIALERTVDPELEYFGPILRNAVSMEQSTDQDLFKNLLLMDISCLESILLSELNECILQKVSDGNLDSTVAALLVCVLEQHIYQDIITVENINSVSSASDELIQIASQSCKVLKSESCSLKHVAAIAFLRRFLSCTVEVLESSMYDTVQHSVLMNNLNGIFEQEVSDSEVNAHRSQSLLLYFLRIICHHCGLHLLPRITKDLASSLPVLKNIEWDIEKRKCSVLVHPLHCYIPDYKKCTDALMLLMLENKDMMMKEVINSAKSDATALMSFLGLLAQKFYLKSIVEEMNDGEKVMASRISNLVDEIKLPDIQSTIVHHLTRRTDLRHPIFHVTSESKLPEPHIVSVLLHILCCITTYGTRGNIFYDCISEPQLAKTRYLPGFAKSPQKLYSKYTPLTCICGIRFISESGLCPQCSVEHDLGDNVEKCDEHVPPEPGYPASEEKLFDEQRSSFDDVSFTLQVFLKWMIHGCFMCSVGVDLSSKGSVSSLMQCDNIEIALQDKLTRDWEKLRKLLQMNNDDMCCFFHLVISKMRSFFTSGLPLHQCKTDFDRKELEQIMQKTFMAIVEKRFAELRDFRKNHYEQQGEDLKSVECQVQELTIVDDQSIRNLRLPKLFRVCEIPTEENLFNMLSFSKFEYPVLHLAMTSNSLVLPQYILPILRWHMSAVAIGSYKIRKVDCKDMNIGKFLTLERDKSRKYLLKQRFEDFKQAWNKLITEHQEVLEMALQMQIPQSMIGSGSRVIDCIIFDDASLIYKVILGLVMIQNSFVDKFIQIAFQMKCRSINFLTDGNEGASVSGTTLENLSKSDIIDFTWDDDWLKYSQCRTELGEGKQISFDLDKIEMEVAHELVFGKKHIFVPKSVSRIVFIDELFQNSIQLLKDLRSSFEQEQLPMEISRGIETKRESHYTEIPELLTLLGMVMPLLKKTGTDQPNMSLVDYLESWDNVLPKAAYKNLLPEPEHCLKLNHILSLYQLLEEIMGEKRMESLEKCYRTELPNDAKHLLEYVGKSTEKHLEKFQKALKVFIHRCLSKAGNDVRSDQPLIDYMSDPDFWPFETLQKGDVIVAKVNVPLNEILSPNLLVEHLYEVTSFIQNFLEDLRMKDQRISSVVATFQSSKQVHDPKSKRKAKIARKGFGKT